MLTVRCRGRPVLPHAFKCPPAHRSLRLCEHHDQAAFRTEWSMTHMPPGLSVGLPCSCLEVGGGVTHLPVLHG